MAAIFQEGVMCWTAHTVCPQGPFLRLREVNSLIKVALLTRGRVGARTLASYPQSLHLLLPGCPPPCTVTDNALSTLFPPSSFPVSLPSCLCRPHQAASSNPVLLSQHLQHPLGWKDAPGHSAPPFAQRQPCPPWGRSGLQSVAADKP